MDTYCFHNTLSLTFLLCLCLCFPVCFSLMSYNNSFCNFDIEKINFGAIQWRKQLKVFNIFHVFKKIYGIALTSCITECLLRQRCWSVNYNNVLQYCELIDSAAETQSSLEITNSFIYTTKNTFLIVSNDSYFNFRDVKKYLLPDIYHILNSLLIKI